MPDLLRPARNPAKRGAFSLRRNLAALAGLILGLAVLFTPARPAALAAAPPTTPGFAPGASVRFDHFSIEDGLSQNAGLALLQDQRGFLWIGTQDGLNRYDGYAFRAYRADPDNPASLSHNSIITLYEDADGSLWIGTWGGGLNRWDPQTDQFTRYLPSPDDPASLSHPIVTEVYRDRRGALWVATLGGLDRLDEASGGFTHFRHNPADPTSLSSDAISTIFEDSEGLLWIGTGAYGAQGAGLNRLDPLTSLTARLPARGDCLAAPNIGDILAAPDGSLWIANGGYSVSGGGLDHYDPASGACRHFPASPETPGALPLDNLVRLLFDPQGALWITTWGGGLARLPAGGETFTIFTHDPADPHSISNDSLIALIQDRSGLLWIGTTNSGVNKLDPDTLQFRHYRRQAANPAGLDTDLVGAFTEDENGDIWVGTWEAGLARFDPQTGSFQHFRHAPDEPASLAADLVMDLLPAGDGKLWVGMLGAGLDLFDPAAGRARHFTHNPEDALSLADNNITTLTVDRQNRLWVGTLNGLSRYDPASGTFVNYFNDPANTASLSHNSVVSFLAEDDQLWIGTWGGGLNRLDLTDPASLNPAAARFTRYAHDPADRNSLSENAVFTIHRSTGGLLWLGTQGGLNRFDPATGEFKAYTEKDGLRSAVILGILEDDAGLLWCSTNNGLARFDPAAETFTIFDVSNGLQSNEFNSNAYFRSRQGEMYFGGVHGMNVFDPAQIRPNPALPNVVITAFKLFNETRPVDLDGGEVINLNFDQDYISLEFAVLDYRAPQKNQYAYRLEGFDPDWVEAGTRNYASYTNLPPGEYTFRVRGANRDGVWNESRARLPINITPPFYDTWPFRGAVLLLLAALATAGFQWRVRAVKDNALRLEKKVAEQTTALRETNLLLEDEIEQRRRAEAELARRSAIELQESQARFKAVFESAAVGMALMSLDRRILQVNQAVERITGYTEAEITRVNPSDLAAEQDRYIDREQYQELIAGQRDQYTIEKRYLRKDGSIFWGRVNFSIVRDIEDQPALVVGLIEDITEERLAKERLAAQDAAHRAELEQRIVERTEELNQANQLLQQKATQEAVVAERTRLARDLHDAVTQSLFSATLIADVLPDLWAINPDDGRQRLEELRQLTRGALAEMRTLLVELRPNALVDVPLPTLLRHLSEALTGRARLNIQLSVAGDRKLPADVKVAIYRIAQEALNNVVKHAHASQVLVSLRQEADPVRLTIADNGAGFDPGGVGGDHLGLRIMRERAEAVGARISLYSEPGEGTQISVVWSDKETP